MTKTITVDVISDVMCPWCYIGKRRLEKAIESLGADLKVSVNWRPYQLDATLPPEGKDRQQYLSDKFGGKEQADGFYATIKQAGEGEGIPFAFDAIAVSPNTLDAHRVIMWAGNAGHHRQDRVVEHLFEAYFVDGKNIGDHAVLTEVAAAAGMDPHDVSEKLKTDVDKSETAAQIAHAQQIGVTGVPCFIIEKKYGVSGAQDPVMLAQAIRDIAAKQG